MHGFHRGFGFFGIGFIFWIIIAIIGIYLITRLVSRDNTRGLNENISKSNAMKILDERYAKGEIDEEEYKRRKEVLRNR